MKIVKKKGLRLMKKFCFALILSLTMICMHSAIAVAQEGQYTAGVNSYTNSISDGANTVMIYQGVKGDPVTADNIYYINQDDSGSGFSKLVMMMKRNAPAGTYTLITDRSNEGVTFEISKAQAAVVGNEEMKCLGVSEKGETYSVAFGISTKSLLTKDSQLSMLLGENLYTTDLDGENSIVKWVFGPIFTTDAQGVQRSVFAIQIDGVGEEYVTTDVETGNLTPNFSLYLKE